MKQSIVGIRPLAPAAEHRYFVHTSPMCMMIYLAADQPLRMLHWNGGEPGFYVSVRAPDEESLRSRSLRLSRTASRTIR